MSEPEPEPLDERRIRWAKHMIIHHQRQIEGLNIKIGELQNFINLLEKGEKL
jgi:hypothetical protein